MGRGYAEGGLRGEAETRGGPVGARARTGATRATVAGRGVATVGSATGNAAAAGPGDVGTSITPLGARPPRIA